VCNNSSSNRYRRRFTSMKVVLLAVRTERAVRLPGGLTQQGSSDTRSDHLRCGPGHSSAVKHRLTAVLQQNTVKTNVCMYIQYHRNADYWSLP
jgi:hypothetical protein